jgi:hypothetical protein
MENLNMTRLFITATIAALVFSTPAVMATEDKPKTFEELSAGMKAHGCKHKLDSDNEQSTLLVTCDLEKVSRDKDLRKSFFVGDLTDSKIARHRRELTASFVANLAAKSLLFYYKTNPDIDQLAVLGRVMGRDDYGHPVDYIAFTYSFDR